MTRLEKDPPQGASVLAQFSPEGLPSLRTDMLRFARLQLRNAELAEDAVQDSIEAACATLRHSPVSLR